MLGRVSWDSDRERISEHERPQDRGQGFVTATVVDPFGNLLGVMYNPHYVEVVKNRCS